MTKARTHKERKQSQQPTSGTTRKQHDDLLSPELIKAAHTFANRLASRLSRFLAENHIDTKESRKFTRETLLGIAAVLQIEEWTTSGVLDAIGESVPLTAPQLRSLAHALLSDDESTSVRVCSAHLSYATMRLWVHKFSWDGEEVLGCDIGVGALDEDALLDELAAFLVEHRHQLTGRKSE